MATVLQGTASALVDVSVGSVVRAILEANAGLALWMQWLILQVLSMTRASTSVGNDLDTWMADFGLTRLPATHATGIVSVSRFSAHLPAFLPLATSLKTADGALVFEVTADPTRSTWCQQPPGYIIPAGVGSLDVPVQCRSPGVAGNVLAGSITVIAAALPGIDQVTNSAAYINGQDVESDADFRERFQVYLSSLSRATLTAVSAAVSGVRQGLSYRIRENVLPDGSIRAGSFVVIVDDGTGYPDEGLLSAVAHAVEVVRPLATTFHVMGPVVEIVNVVATVEVERGVAIPSEQILQKLILAYVDNLEIGAKVSVSRIAQSIYVGAAGIANVSNVTVNGSAADIAAPAGTVFKGGQITVFLNGG